MQNIDLRPTFAELAGAHSVSDVDGSSFAPVLHGLPAPWRTTSLVEYHGPNELLQDPGCQRRSQGNPPT